MITLRTLGECVVDVGSERIGSDSDALFAALLYLATERGRQVSRGPFVELLWPQLAPDRARHCLRQLLYRLRMLGVPIEGRESLLLPDGHVRPTFAAGPSAERLTAERTAGTLRIGPYLPGYWPRFSQPYAEWVDRTRAAVEARVRRVLLEVAHSHRLRGEWDDVDVLARDCLRLDPLNEEATFALAEAAAMMGGKCEAVAILDRYIEDIGPSAGDLRIPATVLRRRIAERFPARRYAAPLESCFVGREALMETLSTALLRARNGEGGAVLLTGAPGIGKSRLIAEATKIAVMQGVRLVRVACEETDQQRPMAAFADAAPQLRSMSGALGVSPESLSYLSRLTDVQAVSLTELDEARDPRWIAGRIRQAIVDLADAVTTEGPVLVVIEDVHWLDAASWASIVALLEWLPTHRMLLLLTSRGPHPTPATPQRCVEQLVAHPVPTLDATASLTLVRTIATDHGAAIPDDDLRWCTDVGEGNPLFLRELVVHCLEGGARHAVPPSLQGLLDARLSRLGAVATRVLQSAAVLGDLSTVERLTRLLELPAHEMAGALDELGQALLLNDTVLSVLPRHELVTARVMAAVGKPLEAFLHRRAAEMLGETVASPGAVESVLAAATHWRAAGEPQRSISVLLDAATHLQSIGASRETIRILQLARELCASDGQAPQVLRLLARALAMDARWSQTAETLSALWRGSTPDAADSDQAADILLAIQAGFRTSADPLPLIELARQVASASNVDVSRRLEAARLGMMIAESYTSDSAQHQLWDAVSQVLHQQPPSSIDVLALELVYHTNVGDMSVAVDRARRLQGSDWSATSPFRSLSLLLACSDALAAAGLFDEALTLSENSVDAARRISSLHFEIRASNRTLSLQFDIGNREAARHWIATLSKLASGIDDELLQQSLIEHRAQLALLDGQHTLAHNLAIRLYEAVSSVQHPMLWQVRSALTLLAESSLAVSGEVDEALIVELERVHHLTANRPLHDRTANVLAEALVRSGKRDAAELLLRDYAHRFRRSLVSSKRPDSEY